MTNQCCYERMLHHLMGKIQLQRYFAAKSGAASDRRVVPPRGKIFVYSANVRFPSAFGLDYNGFRVAAPCSNETLFSILSGHDSSAFPKSMHAVFNMLRCVHGDSGTYWRTISPVGFSPFGRGLSGFRTASIVASHTRLTSSTLASASVQSSRTNSIFMRSQQLRRLSGGK